MENIIFNCFVNHVHCGLLLLSLLLTSCDVCSNEIIKSEGISEKENIVLFVRDAGATTSPSLQISIVDKAKSLKGKGNICITDGDFLDYKIDRNNIEIVYSGELYLSKTRYGNFHITYRKR